MTELEAFLERAIAEDIGDGDHTSLACIPAEATDSAKLLVKENGIIAGVDLAQKIFHRFDPELRIEVMIEDGTPVSVGDIVFTVHGSARSLLTSERLVLNCMQRMSGIATLTRSIADKIADLHTQVLDTRKTTPGIRFMEKEAVRIGGGTNHRYGLFDMMMIKDNHIDYAGGIEQAITAANDYIASTGKQLRIEIETRDMDELRQVLAIGKVDRIMLDNFTPALTKEAVALIDGRYETESSGGITTATIRSYAECGVDFVSMGALTHSVKSMDLSLKAIR